MGAIPFVGEVADSAKLARMGVKAADAADTVQDAVKTADAASEALKGVESGSDMAVYASDKSTRFKTSADYATGKLELPTSHKAFLDAGWEDVTDPRRIEAGNPAREYIKDGIKIVYEDGALGERGFKGIDHYHIINPNATNNYDLYLDKYGNPVPKNSKQSHILKRRS